MRVILLKIQKNKVMADVNATLESAYKGNKAVEMKLTHNHPKFGEKIYGQVQQVVDKKNKAKFSVGGCVVSINKVADVKIL